MASDYVNDFIKNAEQQQAFEDAQKTLQQNVTEARDVTKADVQPETGKPQPEQAEKESREFDAEKYTGEKMSQAPPEKQQDFEMD